MADGEDGALLDGHRHRNIQCDHLTLIRVNVDALCRPRHGIRPRRTSGIVAETVSTVASRGLVANETTPSVPSSCAQKIITGSMIVPHGSATWHTALCVILHVALERSVGGSADPGASETWLEQCFRATEAFAANIEG